MCRHVMYSIACFNPVCLYTVQEAWMWHRFSAQTIRKDGRTIECKTYLVRATTNIWCKLNVGNPRKIQTLNYFVLFDILKIYTRYLRLFIILIRCIYYQLIGVCVQARKGLNSSLLTFSFFVRSSNGVFIHQFIGKR